jgi:hypothetical protein
MGNAWKHFCTITHHKNLVLVGCFKIGLYRQGLLHDLSKYSPTEFLVGCKYYQGTMSPNNAERKEKGYSLAGCITKDAINTISSTGLIMIFQKNRGKNIRGWQE